MHKITLRFLAFVLATSTFVDAARAEEASTAEEPVVPSLQRKQPLAQPLTYEDFQRGEIERSIRRSRNALIGTSAAAVVGAAVYFPWAISCIEYDLQTGSEVRCSSRGAQAGVTISGMVFMGGLVGALVTGIMLGVRKGKLRRLDDRDRSGNPHAVTWDPVLSRFVF